MNNFGDNLRCVMVQEPVARVEEPCAWQPRFISLFIGKVKTIYSMKYDGAITPDFLCLLYRNSGGGNLRILYASGLYRGYRASGLAKHCSSGVA